MKFVSLWIFFLFFSILHGGPLEYATVFKNNSEPLFISMGSDCQIAHMLRNVGMRKAAFPFDWIISYHCDKMIETLETNFQYFTNEKFFEISPLGPGFLLHNYYLLEFLHEGDFRGSNYHMNVENLQTKYARRIERFRNVNAYKGKVFFLRCAFQFSSNDPHRIYLCKDNHEISDEYANQLFAALKKFFPDCNFSLIIINIHNEREILIEKNLSEHLFKIRWNPNASLIERTTAFRNYLMNISRNN